MRGRPKDEDFGPHRPVAVVPMRSGFKKGGQAPISQGDRVRPWLVSGGLATWQSLPYTIPAELDGVQLIASYYVPEGVTAFVKQIKACPFKPSVLHSSASNQLVPGLTAMSLGGNHPDSDDGFWRTPFGWEGYESPEPDPVTPTWRWQLRLVAGDIARIREGLNIPPFSFVDPRSWYLVPNIPVPALGYPEGIPGSSAGDGWGPQRIQRFGMEDGEVHIPVSSDTTVCLFAEWTQLFYQPVFQATDGAGVTTLPQTVFALGPSFGQLEGYTQPNNSPAAQAAARTGWES